MITINITKKKNKIYFKVDDGEEKNLVFDELKKFGYKIVEDTSKNEDNDYNVICESTDLQLYKETLENLIKSIKEDNELIQLYKNTSAEKDS